MKKGSLSTILLVIIFFLGLGLLSYPTVSNAWNQRTSSRAIQSYTATVEKMDPNEYARIIESARIWNTTIDQKANFLTLPEEKVPEYNSLLNIAGDGTMGYINIPKIGVKLPIYHGTSESVLQKGVGHIDNTSLPVGGMDTHCVLSGHRGLPSAKLFTDLDRLVVGDTFVLTTMNETLTYEVDQIRIVLPSEVDDIYLVPGKDLCTLITCTPYGVNTHRLLIRGIRIANAQDYDIYVPNDANRVDPILVAPAVAAPILMLLLLWLIVTTRQKRKRMREIRRARNQQEIK